MPTNQGKEVRSRSLEPRHRWSDLMDRLPLGFWAPPTGLAPSRFFGRGESLSWMPEIESFQRGDEFVVRADLPGLEQKDVTVDVQDDAIVIQGERNNERQEEREGYYSSERSYGQFYRVVPLPEGAIIDSTKASFKNGVLEVVTKAPPHDTRRGRRIDVT